MTTEDQTAPEKTTAEHLDPTTVPKWLMDAAMQSDRAAFGWVASGYLAGVEVARKAGPCGAEYRIMPLAPATADATVLHCEMAHGHRGIHQVTKVFLWSEAE